MINWSTASLHGIVNASALNASVNAVNQVGTLGVLVGTVVVTILILGTLAYLVWGIRAFLVGVVPVTVVVLAWIAAAAVTREAFSGNIRPYWALFRGVVFVVASVVVGGIILWKRWERRLHDVLWGRPKKPAKKPEKQPSPPSG